MQLVHASILVLICLLASGCYGRHIIRSNLTVSPPDCKYDEYTLRERVPARCKEHFIERHNDYLLGFVEFDDQGWFHNPRQMAELMRVLKEESKSSDLIITVYVHGWQHNAEVCDGNVCCFRETLKLIHSLEEKRAPVGKPRKVVGIYVGWRGASNAGLPLWSQASFYVRKNVALQVATGSVRELFANLKHFQERTNEPKDNKPKRNTRLMIVGHSFGGLIVYSAVSQELLNNTLDYDGDSGEDKTKSVKGFGDLVVLINPAFEGARFEPLFHAAHERDYPPGQKPVFIAVTSDNDWATKIAFPFGRRVNGLFFNGVTESYDYSASADGITGSVEQDHSFRDEKQSNLKAVGHIRRYRTHVLDYWPPDDSKHKRRQVAKLPEGCQCSFPNDEQAQDERAHQSLEESLRKKFEKTLVDGHRPAGWVREYASGARLHFDPESKYFNKSTAPDVPFWIVSSRDKRIINGHQDFYTPVFLGFLYELYNDLLR